MFKEKMLQTMKIYQVYRHHDKVAHTKTKTQNNTKTRGTPRLILFEEMFKQRML